MMSSSKSAIALARVGLGQYLYKATNQLIISIYDGSVNEDNFGAMRAAIDAVEVGVVLPAGLHSKERSRNYET